MIWMKVSMVLWLDGMVKFIEIVFVQVIFKGDSYTQVIL